MISKKTVAAVGAGAVAGALGISLAGGAFTASASTPAAIKTGSHAAHKGHGKHASGARGMHGLLHGTGVVKTKTGYETDAFDRGTVTAVTATTVTITAADKDVETFTVVPTSVIRVAGKKAAIGDVKTGEKAGALATVSGSDKNLKFLVIRPAKASA